MANPSRADPSQAEAAAADTLLAMDGLTAGWHGAGAVVGPVSLHLARGEVVGLWGANGSGKSTLLAAIAGQARCFAGHIQLAPGIGLAVQPQAPVRFAPLPITGRELLAMAGADPGGEGLPPSLTAVLGRRLDRISGGQHQLLCVWAALAGAAGLVLLDEPTNNLDPAHTALLAQMLRARRAVRAVLVVSHERAFLEANCTRIVALAPAGAAGDGVHAAPPAPQPVPQWTSRPWRAWT